MSNNSSESCKIPVQTVESKCQKFARERVYGPSIECPATTTIRNETGNEKCSGEIQRLLTPVSTTYVQECKNPSPYSSPCGWFSSNASFNVCGMQRLVPFCQSGKKVPMRGLKIKGIGKKISNSTLHGIESINDLRSWSTCNNDRRKHFLEFMSPVLNNNDDQSFPIDATEEMQRLDEMIPVLDKTTQPLSSKQDIKGVNDLRTDSVEGTSAQNQVSTTLASHPTSTSGPLDNADITVGKQQNNSDDADASYISSTNEVSMIPDKLVAAAENVVPHKDPSVSSEESSASHKRANNTSYESASREEPSPFNKITSQKNVPLEVELPRAYSSHDVINEIGNISIGNEPSGHRVSDDNGYQTASRLSSDERINSGGSVPTEAMPTYDIKTISDFELEDGEVKYIGTEVVPQGKELPAMKSTLTVSNTEVLTFENITETVVDPRNYLEYLGSEIIPSEDLDALIVSKESQNSRLEGVDAILQLEKLKTQLAQVHKALEAEKNKSHVLEKQLNQIITEGSQQNTAPQTGQQQETGDVSSYRDSPIDHNDDISILMDKINDLKCREAKYVLNLQCAILRIKKVQEENNQCRLYIIRLEEELQHYATKYDS